MIKKIAFVSHPTRDIEASKKFYGEVLGLRHVHDLAGGKWTEFETPDGKTVAVDTFAPEGSPPYLALETDDIEAEVARLKEAGVKMHGELMDNKVCKMQLIEDPAGHVLMIHQIAPERIAGGGA